ncbi:hypothetical protein CC78DRAFT_466446, partial [Lojkania enalia]
ILEKAYTFLQLFTSATLYREGNRALILLSLKLMDSLLVYYKKNKVSRAHSLTIKIGWFILDKYYTITEEAPVYTTTLLLNPSCQVAYFKKNWLE